MNLKWNFGNGVLVLPASVLEVGASQAQLCVLLWLAADPSLASKPSQLAKLADCSLAEAKNALLFWQSVNVLASSAGSEKSPSPEPQSTSASQKASAKKPPRLDVRPQYSTSELADMMEQRESLRCLIDAASNVLGKVIQRVSDVRILASFVDYYGFEEEFVLLLLKFCKEKKGKTTLGWIEKFAIGLRDDYGIETTEALEKWIRNDELVRSLEGKVRKMFGVKDRELVSSEKNCLVAWAEFGYGEEIVRLAFEITIANIKEPSFPYTHSILERWHAEGLSSVEDIRRKIDSDRSKREAKTKNKKSPASLGNSFDTDDFFEAALKRSFDNPIS